MQNNPLPLSPHLQVHHWYFTMFLSILHRATGVALVAGTVLFAWWLLAGASGEESFAQFHVFTASWIGQIMLFGWLYSYIFHFLNGVRHLVWDWGHGLDLKSAQRSGLVVFAGSLLLTAFMWFVIKGVA
jgi:succinate dehydrogenase / fumarate reductase cytochrome b subunit